MFLEELLSISEWLTNSMQESKIFYRFVLCPTSCPKKKFMIIDRQP
jgi:DUF438 domain-containing protein